MIERQTATKPVRLASARSAGNRNRPGVTTGLLLLTLVALGGGWYWQSTKVAGKHGDEKGVPASTASMAQETSVVLLTTPTEAIADDTAPTDVQQALSDTSLAGLEIPNSLMMDGDQLVANEGLRELMDFFLTLTGEREPAQIRALFAAAATAQCAAICAEQALVIYDHYLEYLRAMETASADLQDTDDLRSRLQRVAGIRSEFLGEEVAKSLFAAENAYDNLRVAQWEIRTQTDLSAAEKSEALAALESSLPPDLAAREQERKLLRSVRNLNRTLDEQQKDAADRYAARAALLDVAAAERLQALDTRRAEWAQRYEAYRQERTRLDISGLDTVDRQQALEQLRLRHFSAQESQRAAALDRVNGLER
ncbi:MAG TPA: lipase secretion chaperone [Candidatus Kapabacteria bacterium]|nr:lipase secretion chaperone [Candidatus Kapabacteria bacterium]